MSEFVMVVTEEDVKNLTEFRIPLPNFRVGECKNLYKLKDFSNYQYIERQFAETEPKYKQIIPYCVICQNDDAAEGRSSYFIYRRTKKSGEKRLSDLYSLGIGGHLNTGDHSTSFWATFKNGLSRELKEELIFQPQMKVDIQNVCYLYDDSNEVGKVHLGVVVFIMLDIGVSCKLNEDSLDSGQFVSKLWLKENIAKFESWSQIVINQIL